MATKSEETTKTRLRVQLMSDLHLEFEDKLQSKKSALAFKVPVTNSDVIILAGDIGNKLRGIDFAYKTSIEHKKPVIYVAGNHEAYSCVWETFIGKIRERDQQLKVKYPDANVHFLEQDQVIINGVRFIGCTLWTDFRIGMPLEAVGLDSKGESDTLVERYRHTASKMNDYKRIRSITLTTTGVHSRRLVPPQVVARHKEHLGWLKKCLKMTDPKMKIVVVTHHPPHPLCIDPAYKGDPMNCAFVNDLTYLMTLPLSSSEAKTDDIVSPDLWICGHTHYGVDFVVGNTRIVSNARGYPSEPASGRTFDPLLVIEV